MQAKRKFKKKILATDPEARVRFPALSEKKNVVGLERGPLSLVSNFIFE
jgi:hypothetical protein